MIKFLGFSTEDFPTKMGLLQATMPAMKMTGIETAISQSLFIFDPSNIVLFV